MNKVPEFMLVDTDETLDEVSDDKECSDEKEGSKCTTRASSDCNVMSPNLAISQPRHVEPQEQREHDKP